VTFTSNSSQTWTSALDLANSSPSLNRQPPPPPLQAALKSATITTTEEEAKTIVARWAGHPEIAEAYRLVLSGSLVIDLTKAIGQHRPGSRCRWSSCYPVAVAPLGISKLSVFNDHRGFIDMGGIKLPSICGNPPLANNTAIVPTVPDAYLPTIKERRKNSYAVLFEPVWERQEQPENWDPALIRRVSGSLFEVVEVWDLTPIEAAALNMARVK
jgi:hypothetical protein